MVSKWFEQIWNLYQNACVRWWCWSRIVSRRYCRCPTNSTEAKIEFAVLPSRNPALWKVVPSNGKTKQHYRNIHTNAVTWVAWYNFYFIFILSKIMLHSILDYLDLNQQILQWVLFFFHGYYYLLVFYLQTNAFFHLEHNRYIEIYENKQENDRLRVLACQSQIRVNDAYPSVSGWYINSYGDTVQTSDHTSWVVRDGALTSDINRHYVMSVSLSLCNS